jgi:hypothetical protein
MKFRITLLVVLTVAIGAIVVVAMTKADLIAAISAKIGFDEDGDGVVKKYYNCLIADIPSDRSEVIVEDRTGKKIPGLVRFENLILQFPAGKVPPEILGWYEIIIQGREAPKNGVLVILNDAGEEQARYNLLECWPCALRALKKARVGFRGNVVDEIELVVGKYELAPTATPPVGK